MDQAEKLRRLAMERKRGARRARVIAVTSGKGGVDKTNITVNLAICLSRMGLKVGVLDGDLGLANVDIVLGITPEFNLGDVLYGQKRLGDIVVEGPEGLSVLAGGSGVYELANLSQWKLQRFINEIGELDQTLDILLIDTGAGISRNVMGFVLACDEAVVVTTPEVTSITDAYGVIKLLAAERPSAPVGVVVNMSRNEREAEKVLRSLNAVAEQFIRSEARAELLGFVPPDPAVRRAVHEQEPFAISYPRSAASQSVQSIAAKLAGSDARRRTGGIGRLFRRMAEISRRT